MVHTFTDVAATHRNTFCNTPHHPATLSMDADTDCDTGAYGIIYIWFCIYIRNNMYTHRMYRKGGPYRTQCVAVCCSALQYAAFCCSVLQRVAAWCRVLQRVAVYCSELQSVNTIRADFTRVRVDMCCIMLQCVALCCSVLQRVAEHQHSEGGP